MCSPPMGWQPLKKHWSQGMSSRCQNCSPRFGQTTDFIIIDLPPGKAMLAFNALAAADLILIVASAERAAVDGVADLISHVQGIM